MIPTMEQVKAREAQFRVALRTWILQTDQKFRNTELLDAGTVPLRHPKDQVFTHHSREYLWSDAIWCQDRSTEVFEEFYEAEEWYMEADGDGGHPVILYVQQIFDEEFRAVMPSELHHVLEG